MKQKLLLALAVGLTASAHAAPLIGAGLQQLGTPGVDIAPQTTYGIDVPVRSALKSLVPPGWRLFIHKSTQLPAALSWTPSDVWTDVLGTAALGANLSVVVDWNTRAVLVRPLDIALQESAVRQEVAQAASTPLPKFSAAPATATPPAVSAPAGGAPEAYAIATAPRPAFDLPVKDSVPLDTPPSVAALLEERTPETEKITVAAASTPLISPSAADVAPVIPVTEPVQSSEAPELSPTPEPLPLVAETEAPLAPDAPVEDVAAVEPMPAPEAPPTPAVASEQLAAAVSAEAPLGPAAEPSEPEALPVLAAPVVAVALVETREAALSPVEATTPIAAAPVALPSAAPVAVEPSNSYSITADGQITAVDAMTALYANSEVQTMPVQLAAVPGPAAVAALSAMEQAPTMTAPPTLVAVPLVPALRVNPSVDMVAEQIEKAPVAVKSTGDFTYTKPVALNKPDLRVVAQGIATRFGLRLVWTAPDVQLQGPVTLLSDTSVQDVTLLQKALGRFAPVTVALDGAALRVTSRDAAFVARHQEAAAQDALAAAVRAAAAAGPENAPALTKASSAPFVNATEAVVRTAPMRDSGQPADMQETGAESQGSTLAHAATHEALAAPAPAQSNIAPESASEFVLTVEAGGTLEQSLKKFLQARGYTHEWKVAGGFEATRKRTFTGSTLVEVLAQALPPLGVSADIYTVEKHIVIRPGDYRE